MIDQLQATTQANSHNKQVNTGLKCSVQINDMISAFALFLVDFLILKFYSEALHQLFWAIILLIFAASEFLVVEDSYITELPIAYFVYMDMIQLFWVAEIASNRSATTA